MWKNTILETLVEYGGYSIWEGLVSLVNIYGNDMLNANWIDGFNGFPFVGGKTLKGWNHMFYSEDMAVNLAKCSLEPIQMVEYEVLAKVICPWTYWSVVWKLPYTSQRWQTSTTKEEFQRVWGLPKKLRIVGPESNALQSHLPQYRCHFDHFGGIPILKHADILTHRYMDMKQQYVQYNHIYICIISLI